MIQIVSADRYNWFNSIINADGKIIDMKDNYTQIVITYYRNKTKKFEIINHHGYVHPSNLVLVYLEDHNNKLILMNLNPDDRSDIDYFFSQIS